MSAFIQDMLFALALAVAFILGMHYGRHETRHKARKYYLDSIGRRKEIDDE
jgi:hypothetical protein